MAAVHSPRRVSGNGVSSKRRARALKRERRQEAARVAAAARIPRFTPDEEAALERGPYDAGFHAVETGSVNLLSHVVRRLKADPNTVVGRPTDGVTHWSLLGMAAWRGRAALVAWLLDHRGDVTLPAAVNQEVVHAQWTVLELAVRGSAAYHQRQAEEARFTSPPGGDTLFDTAYGPHRRIPPMPTVEAAKAYLRRRAPTLRVAREPPFSGHDRPLDRFQDNFPWSAPYPEDDDAGQAPASPGVPGCPADVLHVLLDREVDARQLAAEMFGWYACPRHGNYCAMGVFRRLMGLFEDAPADGDDEEDDDEVGGDEEGGAVYPGRLAIDFALARTRRPCAAIAAAVEGLRTPRTFDSHPLVRFLQLVPVRVGAGALPADVRSLAFPFAYLVHATLLHDGRLQAHLGAEDVVAAAYAELARWRPAPADGIASALRTMLLEGLLVQTGVHPDTVLPSQPPALLMELARMRITPGAEEDLGFLELLLRYMADPWRVWTTPRMGLTSAAAMAWRIPRASKVWDLLEEYGMRRGGNEIWAGVSGGEGVVELIA